MFFEKAFKSSSKAQILIFNKNSDKSVYIEFEKLTTTSHFWRKTPISPECILFMKICELIHLLLLKNKLKNRRLPNSIHKSDAKVKTLLLLPALLSIKLHS